MIKAVWPESETRLREQLVQYAQCLESSGLSVGKSGNLSARCGNDILITPSAIAYEALEPEKIVAVDLQGNCRDDDGGVPSSEWRFHCDIYRDRPDAAAIVHAHSPACTALACTGRAIPAFHYMVAVAGGTTIPIADYALFGTEQLSLNIQQSLGKLNACLLANHGMLALGGTVAQAFNLAKEVESIAHQYCLALSLGEVQLLSDEDMADVLAKFQTYGQRV